MKIVRFETKYTPASYGWIDQTKLALFKEILSENSDDTTPEFSLSELKLLVPCLPSKIIAVGRNYEEHIREMNQTPPEIPCYFLSRPPPSSAAVTQLFCRLNRTRGTRG